ncbi:MAG: Asp-tRNA(Asn)/Glu-tRNA(Gln) amidotransferase subunit GatC [SAR324 cluster bacterium]|nr:Asp-tRNA(Asn)/Glu-tRNA(Gln) amidotransferase subunit GatC [SAR324 cluster bacterium]
METLAVAPRGPHAGSIHLTDRKTPQRRQIVAEPIITLAEIEKIARLASLELTQEEKEQFVRQFEDILTYFKKLDAVQLSELQDRPAESTGHMRDDAVVKSDVVPESFSPYLESGHFKVPKVIE